MTDAGNHQTAEKFSQDKNSPYHTGNKIQCDSCVECFDSLEIVEIDGKELCPKCLDKYLWYYKKEK